MSSEPNCLVSQLFNGEGLLLSYREFLSKYDFPVTPKEFAMVFSAYIKYNKHIQRK